MAYKLKTALGKAIYRARKCTVEPVIGIIKEVMGFRQFSLRGELAEAFEWCLVWFGLQSQALPYLIRSVTQEQRPTCSPLAHDHRPFSVGDHAPLSRFRPCREGRSADEAADMAAALFSPTSC